ncbi:hypothetical protein [Micromonospora endolithica]|uniref:Integral membrane protein n=1 Tax=Micromonospora endolithica TaxID=230091 RepID=A0A3A9ZSB4_9ACTN|nr:hypothetical protein [Micromonospora endolithica]RKN51162.1 hypothetical protein D7223_05505 [Micromonospora endolithica]TWJ22367.1 hypothetical protein JD76_02482 [Micromonospora endolithica]
MTADLTARTAVTAGTDRSLLRLALRIDALASGASGLAFAPGAALVADPLGLPTALLVPVGIFLLGYAAALWLLAARPRIDRRAAAVVVVVNLIWAVDSVVLLAGGWFTPTMVGVVVIAAQAAAVAGFAAVQWIGLRRDR